MRTFRLMLLGLLAALPAAAGEVYVPFVAADEPGFDSGRSTVPAIELFNLGGVPRRYSVHLTPAGEDGTKVRQLVGAGLVDPHAFRQEACCNRESGLLVVTGAPQIAVAASLGFVFNQPPPNAVTTRIPVVTARDALPAGSTAVLQSLGIAASDAHRSSFGILNLGRAAAECTIDTDAGFFARFLLHLEHVAVPPLSVAAFPDVFGPLRGPRGPTSLTMRMRITCDQPFYPFGVHFVGFSPFFSGFPSVSYVPPSLQLGSAP